MVTYSDLPFDIIDYLCSTVSETDGKGLCALSLVDRRTRSACVPLLFMDILYDRQWGENELGWDGFKPSVDALLANEAIKGAIKGAHFRPWVRRPETNLVPGVFFDLLFSLRNLSTLDIGLQFEHIAQVKKEFNAVDDILPSVNGKAWYKTFCPSLPKKKKRKEIRKALVKLESLIIPSPDWMFLAECSPNLTSLEVVSAGLGRWYTYESLDLNVVRLGKSHPNLKRLHCRETGMTGHIQEIAMNLPKIEDLGLYGPFQNTWSGETAGIMDHLKAYSAFKHLKSLSLPGVIDLGMGYDPPWCGNAYFDDPGLGNRLEKQADEIVARVMHGISTEIIMQERSTLSNVVVGRHGNSLTTWEKGENGELYESKCVERSLKTGKILKVTDLRAKAESVV